MEKEITITFGRSSRRYLIERGVIDPTANVNIYLSKVGVHIEDRFPEPVEMRDLLVLRAGRFDRLPGQGVPPIRRERVPTN